MKPKFIIITFVVLAVLVFGTYMIFFAAPQAVARLILQVNPGITLILDERNIVIGVNTAIGVEGLDPQGEALLGRLDLTGKELQEALRVISDDLVKAGLLGPEQRILMALHPVEGRLGVPELTALSENVRQILSGQMVERGLAVEVKIIALTTDVADTVLAAGLLPADYVDDYFDLIAAIGQEAAMQVLALQPGLGLDLAVFNEKVGTITSALLDMIEAGMTQETALAVLKGALVADPNLEELTTITAAMIDLHEAGATQDNIFAIFQMIEMQIAAGMDRALMLEEITTITAAKIDMLEAGISSVTALSVLETALQADSTLEELTTITAVMIDLIEEGLSKEEAFARIQTAIVTDPTLENFGELIKQSIPIKLEQEINSEEPQQRRQLEQGMETEPIMPLEPLQLDNDL